MLVICGEEQVNNAGISRGETDADVFDTNYYGVKRVTAAILPLLRPSPAGARIINVSSGLGGLRVNAASPSYM
jgi:carbonyl reductase 1